MADDPHTLGQGRYSLLEQIGQGGMARVWRAFDQRLRAERAIKILDPTLANRGEVRRRFEQEAHAMARINHPNVVTIHDVLEERDKEDRHRIAIVMELLEGGSLTSWIQKRGPIPPERVVPILVLALCGLEAAHAAGVIHRDIKPGNILLTAGQVPKLSDFGIARIAETEAPRTRTGTVLGTWAYLAPETRFDSTQATVASDIYGVGATLFAVITGSEPFDLYAPHLRPAQFEAIPAEIRGVIHRATAYDPARRYASAAALRGALEALSFASSPAVRLPQRLPENLHPTDAAALPGRRVFVLTGSLRTGNAEIDRQHEEMLRWGHGLLRDHSHPDVRARAAEGYQFLARYALQHFNAEETVMGSLRYPDLAAHARVHAGFREEIRGILAAADMDGDGEEARVRLHRLLTVTLVDHIHTLDRALATFMAAHPRAAVQGPAEDPVAQVRSPLRRWLERWREEEG